MAGRCLVLHPADEVATALADLAAGETLAPEGATPGIGRPLATIEAIRFGHKVALRDLAAGETVHKYGEAIGTATAAIRAGAHVHVHNLASDRARGDREPRR
jgi:altronate dehydratase small subunit